MPPTIINLWVSYTAASRVYIHLVAETAIMGVQGLTSASLDIRP